MSNAGRQIVPPARKFTFDKSAVTSYYLEGDKLVVEGLDDLSPSDGYHTTHELYEHRMALTAALFKHIHVYRSYPGSIKTFKSKLHYDRTMFDGYFITGIDDRGKCILSYHYDIKYWDLFQVPELDFAPEYDGHGNKEVIERLLKL